jgi:AsmA protein
MAITDGNLVNKDLLLLLANFKADGTGRIGLGAQDIDYLFTPVALRANSGSGLAIPVRIRGPWADPKITPDVSAAIDLNLAKQKEKLEKKAREEVDRAVQKELGVKPKEGQSTEDALQDKVEDELKRGLLKMFE